jgi:hypothetical protein
LRACLIAALIVVHELFSALGQEANDGLGEVVGLLNI